MGPSVRLAYDNGARQSVGDVCRAEAAVRPVSRVRRMPLRAGFTMWETGLDNPEQRRAATHG
ncbi:hypothetical protein GCM10010451_09260 [Streptomyces virens]|uniref:Uncharacterized protein n=1 Tax=Streptomyces virens TaxID=285572 RepID=A0ABP6P0H4_9ACTN